MGDYIQNLAVNKKLKVNNKDESNLQKFFDVNVNTSTDTICEEKSLIEMVKFVAIFSIIFYICIHPASVARFVENPVYKPFVQTATFAIILFLYLYFNK